VEYRRLAQRADDHRGLNCQYGLGRTLTAGGGRPQEPRRAARRAGESIRATFVLDVGLIWSFGRKKGEKTLGLSEKQQEFLVALALWKIQRLLASPFRFRSGCHLRCTALVSYEQEVELDVDIGAEIKAAGFGPQPITDVFWPREELYREGKAEAAKSAEEDDETEEFEE
jgi:CRISPR-associated protein Csb1